ncbi:hypothetical protein OMCYN_01680 [cyanobiont of Ornithocercus magnificus]|nr:hypothetical protein OMCYN_01680 [cyanobiont of Ornithocercus magnificus]
MDLQGIERITFNLPHKSQPMSTDIDKTLKDRGALYGPFVGHARIVRDLMKVIRLELEHSENYLEADQEEALHMIFHKIARIVNGNPNHIDSWHDIVGYAKLVEDILRDKQNV